MKTMPFYPSFLLSVNLAARGRKKALAATALIFLLYIGLLVPCSLGAPPSPSPVNVAISNTTVGPANKTGQYRMMTFDIAWDDGWRMKTPPSNWDAAWVFVKYQVGGGEWNHATLSANPQDHRSPSGTTVTPAPDGKGIFLYRSNDGTGLLRASGLSLRWNYGSDRIADDAPVKVKVLALAMVYIPEGEFLAGDNGASDAALRRGSKDNRPWLIAGEDPIGVTDTASGGHYYVSSKDTWNEKWNANEDATGSSFTIPAEYPKGFRAIYCMKYELSQQQYVDFLNTLTRAQALNRYDRANFDKFGYTIAETDGVYSTSHPERRIRNSFSARGLGHVRIRNGILFLPRRRA